MATVLDSIKHYQKHIEHYPNDEQRLLRCIEKLFKLPVSVQHLQETGVGRTVNALRKEPGEVGTASRALVNKWKLMVAAEESSGAEDDHHDVPNGPYKDSDGDSDHQTKNESEDHSGHETDHVVEQQLTNGSYRQGSKRSHISEDDLSDRELKKYKSDKSTLKNKCKEQSSSTEESADEKPDRSKYAAPNPKIKKERSSCERSRKESTSSVDYHAEHSAHDETEDDDSENYKTKHKDYSGKSALKEKIHKSHSDKHTERSDKHSERSDKHSERSDKHSERSDKHSERRDKHIKEKSEHKSTEYRSESKESRHSDKSKHDRSDSKSKHKGKSSSEKENEKSSEDKRIKQEIKMKKDTTTEVKRHSKKPEKGDSSSSKHESRNQETPINSKTDRKEHSDRYKEKSGKNELKENHKKDRHSSDKLKNKDSKVSHKSGSDKEKHKHVSSKEKESSHSSKKDHKSQTHDKTKSSEKIVEKAKNAGKEAKRKSSSDSNRENVPKKLKENNDLVVDDGIDCESGASFAEALGMISPSKPKKKRETLGKESTSSIENFVPPKPPSSLPNDILSPVELLSPSAKLSPLPPLEISALPEISPNYRPRPPPKLLSHLNEDEALNAVMSTKNQRTKVYSGNKTHGTVPSLYELCIFILQQHIDDLEYTGGVPYDILKPVVDKASPEQLFMLEHFNPYLMDDTDHLWKAHCEKRFRNKRRLEMETWREMYIRCQDEQEARLKSLTTNIKLSQDARNAPVKQTKMAYVDSIAKPPRNIARKQAIHGTARMPVTSPAARVAALAGTVGPVVKAGTIRPQPTGPSTSSASFKPKKAPLMAKALQFMRGKKR